MTTRAPVRLLRTGVIGAVIIGLAAAGHVAGGGTLPEPGILTALATLTLLPVAALTKFRLRLPVLGGLLAAGQAWLHWAFHALSGPDPSSTPALSGHAGHLSQPAPELFTESMPAHSAGSDWLMFAAHAVATLLTALILARGEQAVWALAAWLRPLVQLAAPTAVELPRVAGPTLEPVVLPLDRLGRRLPSRRGPPALQAA